MPWKANRIPEKEHQLEERLSQSHHQNVPDERKVQIRIGDNLDPIDSSVIDFGNHRVARTKDYGAYRSRSSLETLL